MLRERDEQGRFVTATKEVEKEENLSDLELLEREIQEKQAKLNALREAEAKKAEEAKKAAVEKVKAERSADVAKVQSVANEYLKLVAANNKARADLKKAEDEKYAEYKKELNEFAAKHRGYHLTYSIDGDNVEFQLEEAHVDSIEEQFRAQQEQFRKLWNNWFNF